MNTLVYDAENHATSSSGSLGSGTYIYDGNGLRVKKTSVVNGNSTTTVYVFSGSKVIAEYDNGVAPASPSREYVYGGGALLAKIDSSGTKYYHQDHLSNRLVTSSTGATLEQMGHFSFGESWYNSTGDKLLFTTYERDAESGNDYAQARYYANRLARFSILDPLSGSTSDPQSLNRYLYSRNDPINLIDPTGMLYEVCQLISTDDNGGSDPNAGYAEANCVTITNDAYDNLVAGSPSVTYSDGNISVGGTQIGTYQEVPDNSWDNGGGTTGTAGTPTVIGGGGGGGGGFWTRTWKRTKAVTVCAAQTAHQLSPSGVFGVDPEKHPFLNALGDNTFSGVADFTSHVVSLNGQAVASDVIYGGARQGLPGGGGFSKGLAGIATEAVVNAVSEPAPLLSITGTAAEVGSEGLTGPVGWAKLGIDAAIFGGSALYCATQ
jgi:RHS repeat-associated protein